jgi:hypothetical protein
LRGPGTVYSFDLVKSRLLLAVPALAAAALVAQAALAGPARAAGPRYASPTGSSASSCLAPAAACTIDTAVNQAAAGDEVIIAPGTYDLGAVGLSNGQAGLSVHGVAGQPRPVITSSASTGLDLTGNGDKVADLTIIHSGSQYGLNVFASGILVQRVEVHSSGAVTCGLGYAGTARDLLCVNTADTGGIAVDDSWNGGTGVLTLRNLTAVATGSASYGVRAAASDRDTTLAVSARNVIASGTQADVRASGSGSRSLSAVVLQNSNYDSTEASGLAVTVTAAGTGTNQKTAPLFADTVTYHQAAGSPTIDKGATDGSVGTGDLDGDPRLFGTAVDIGVDEYVPDTTPPDVAFDHTPKRTLHRRKATFAFHASEPATFTCRVDKKAPVACASPFGAKVTRHGKQTLTVTATDTAGNVDPTPATRSWRFEKKGRRHHKPHHHGHHHRHHHHGLRDLASDIPFPAPRNSPRAGRALHRT